MCAECATTSYRFYTSVTVTRFFWHLVAANSPGVMMMELMMQRALPPALRRQLWAAAASTTKQNDSSGGLFTAPWMSVQTRGLRDYPVKPLVRNHKFLRKGYEVDKEWSLGIELKPSEVKSLRDRNADLSSAFGEFYKGELFLHHMTIPGMVSSWGRRKDRRSSHAVLHSLEKWTDRPTRTHARAQTAREQIGAQAHAYLLAAAQRSPGMCTNTHSLLRVQVSLT
jgi:hypothetical protein